MLSCCKQRSPLLEDTLKRLDELEMMKSQQGKELQKEWQARMGVVLNVKKPANEVKTLNEKLKKERID
ncbi:UNVERIFIED_CONTAM: hypothetical protein Slati_2956200 [Sesamum latifolium]|uniref:Uncharacterized protein n=1 Tax=Sesamum latifolium TaxID=2727402 RepID=A0AAW2VFR4_9LAMI